MKIEFIKRGAATRLILIFAGWSTDARYYNDCVADGWDTAVVSDYRDMTLPSIPSQYFTVYLFAYSLGVTAASRCHVPAAVRIAICGSPCPVSDAYGIPEAIYSGTIDGLNERTLQKFHLRMSGEKNKYESIKIKLPLVQDINCLKEELVSIRDYSANVDEIRAVRFDRVYLAESDRIFPYANLQAYWNNNSDTEVVSLNQPHAVDVASIVKACLPNTKAIGDGFARAGDSYNENAVIQKEICKRIGETLEALCDGHELRAESLLEIGVGGGLLTEVWRSIMKPERATYIDLIETQVFNISDYERYLKVDAEDWLENSEEKFDIILSASTIQWFANPVGFIQTVRGHLNPGGIAVISTFVKGNLGQLDSMRPSPIFYHTEEEYASIGVSSMQSWDHTIHFDSAKELMMHLRLTGVSPNRTKLSGYEKIGSLQTLKRLNGLPKELTYRPMILVIKV